MTKKSNLFSGYLTKQNNSKPTNGTLRHETMDEIYLSQGEPHEALERAIEGLTRKLLLPKLISVEVDVEKIEVRMPNSGGA